MASREALAAYRSLLRVTLQGNGGGGGGYKQTVKSIRQFFEENRHVTAEEELRRLIKLAKDVSDSMWAMNHMSRTKEKIEKEHTEGTLEVPSEESLSKSRE